MCAHAHVCVCVCVCQRSRREAQFRTTVEQDTATLHRSVRWPQNLTWDCQEPNRQRRNTRISGGPGVRTATSPTKGKATKQDSGVILCTEADRMVRQGCEGSPSGEISIKEILTQTEEKYHRGQTAKFSRSTEVWDLDCVCVCVLC